MRLTINSKDYTDSVLGLDRFKITATSSLDREGFAFSETVTFVDDAYELIYNTFFKSCGNFTEQLEARFYSDACGLNFDLFIRADSVSVNPSKRTAEVRLISEDASDSFIQILKKTFVGDNGFDVNIDHPKLPYYTQPTTVIYYLILVRGSLFFIFDIITVIFSILQGIINALRVIANIIPGVNIPKVELPEMPYRFIDDLIAGGGKYATAPLVREIYDYHCNANGYKFVSSIFNEPTSPYYNTCIPMLQNEEGNSFRDNVNFQTENQPFESLFELLEKLKQPFNAEFFVLGDTLYFERKDFRFKKIKELFTINTCEGEEYSYNVEQLYASWIGEFSRDSVDTQGNKMMRFGFFGFKDWNSPPNKAQKNVDQRIFPFSTVRGVFDRYSERVSGKLFDFDYQIDRFRMNRSNIVFSATGIALAGLLSPTIKRFNGTSQGETIILSNDVIGFLKLVILDDNFVRSRALPKRDFFRTLKGENFFEYNKDLKIDRLYDRFHYIDNPRENGLVKFEVSDLELDLKCEDIRYIEKNAIFVGIRTPLGLGVAEEFEIDFNACKVTAKGVVVYCGL